MRKSVEFVFHRNLKFNFILEGTKGKEEKVMQVNKEYDGVVRYCPGKANMVADTYERDYAESELSHN
jgi:hypothetical protein